MRMARAEQREVEMLIDFFSFIEEFMEHGTYTPPSDDVEEDSIDLSDEQFVAKLREMWGCRFGPALVDASWRRVVFGYQVLHDNLCNKDVDFLDLRSDMKAFLEANGFEEGKEDGHAGAVTEGK